MSILDTIKKTVNTVGSVTKKTYGPLAPLEEQFRKTDLRYPMDVGDPQRFPHTVEFQCWEPEQVSLTDTAPVKKITDKVKTGFNAVASAAVKGDNLLDKAAKNLLGINVSKERLNTEAYQIPVASEPFFMDNMKINENQKKNSRLLDFTRRAKPTDLITMYIPQGAWNDRINNQYAQQSMTSALGTLGAIADVGGDIAKQLSELHIGGAAASAWNMINGPAGMELLGKISSGVGMNGEAVRDAGLTALGYALNPQFEMLYAGTDLREFQFDFTMTPRTEKEALMIRNIVQKFKFHGSPEYKEGQGRYIVPPSYFDVTFKFKGERSDWLPQISTCVLKAFDVDYTGGLDQWGSHADGSPIQVRMVMTFVELEMMHKALRKEGY